MVINKKLLAIFAIFLVLASISAISAEDNETVNDDSQNQEESVTPSEDDLAPNEKNPDGVPNHPDEDEDPVGDNPYRHGEKTPNEKAFDEESAAVQAAGGESKTVSASGSPTTGNPILVLLAAMAVLGAFPLSRRK